MDFIPGVGDLGSTLGEEWGSLDANVDITFSLHMSQLQFEYSIIDSFLSLKMFLFIY